MPKELNTIKDKVMSEIEEGKVRMRPRVYFLLGSALTLVGLLFSAATSVFFFGLIKFGLRMYSGSGGRGRFLFLLENFPWWAPLLGIGGLVAGILLLKRYEFSYKMRTVWVVVLFVLFVLLVSWTIDATGLNEALFQHGPMKGMFMGHLKLGL